MFFLINIIIGFVLGFIDGFTGSASAETGVGLLGGLYTLAVIIPSLAVLVRRMHDTGRSGVWFFIVFVPLVGVFVLLYFLVQPGDPDENDYGHSSDSELVI